MQPHFINAKLIHSITTSTVIKHSKTRLAEQTCLSLLQTCNSLSNLTQIQSHILKLGLHNNPLVLTKFASTSSNLNAIDYSTSFIFSNTCLYDTFLFNTIIRAYSQTFQFKYKAISFYNLMLIYGILPNKFTYPFVLKACAGLLDLKLGQSVHGSVTKYGFDKDLNVQNTIIHMYCCCDGGVEIGWKIFDEMPRMDSVSWSAMIGGYVRAGRSNDAIGLFRKMQGSRVKADEITMVSVLSACSDLGALELGKWVAAYIEKEGIEMSVELFNALIDMFAKCGDVEEGLRLFQRMGVRNIISWTSVIVGLAMHGRGAEAIALFEEMKGDGMDPDEVVFIGLLMACSHSGLVEEGKKYYTSMMNEFGIVPKIEHYGCMVDLFCRAGLVEQALDFVQTMPFEPNAVIMRTLVNACRVHGKLELGEMYTKQLLQNEPMHDSNYVLLSNIYAKMLWWEQKSKIREVMVNKGMKKIPGSTKIELDNEIYEFVAGDKSHSQHKEIYEMVNEMGREIKKAGYIPTTSEVLLDLGEEDKEDTLNWHSEKLALAFALLKTPPGTPIRIVKNLRVCGDCHSATKFISKVYNRDIVVRDRNRFHHFKDGLCSCRDFW